MTDDTGRNHKNQFGEKELAFFGAITASVSHELNNVISIIDQTAGLLQDLLAGTGPDRPIANERLQKIADSVATQTERGVRIIKRLNTFAHSVDDPIKEFEINPTVENLIALARRFASLKRTEIEISLTEPSAKITNSPFRVQQVIFACLKHILNESKPGNKIFVSVAISTGSVSIVIDGAVSDQKESDIDFLEMLSDRVNGQITFSTDNERARFELTLPIGQ
jgi:C4-dicarboxylate-specific signal transduction histidine kinase